MKKPLDKRKRMCYNVLTSVGGFFVVLSYWDRQAGKAPTRGRYDTMGDTMVFMERKL